MTSRLDGKVAVITGGASGMGLATVERFVAEGAKVVFCDLPPYSEEAVAANPRLKGSDRVVGGSRDGNVIAARLGDAARFVPADVSNREQLENVIDTAVREFGGLDIVFNNAGIAVAEGSILEASEEVFDRTVAIDLKAVWLGIKLAIPHLRKRGGGSIISTASIAALGGIRGLGAYSAAKGGVVAMSRTAASELGPDNIRVNVIAPGMIITGIAADIIGGEFDQSAFRQRLIDSPVQPIPRPGEGTDIAGAALWLASDDSSFVTGQTIAVDGGASSHSWLNNSPDQQETSR